MLAPHLSERANHSGAPFGEADDCDGADGADGADGLSALGFVHGPQGGGHSAPGAENPSTRRRSDPARSPSSRLRDRDGQEWWAAARPCLFGFVAKYLELSLVRVGPRLTNAVLVSVARGASGGAAAAAAAAEVAVAEPAVDAVDAQAR